MRDVTPIRPDVVQPTERSLWVLAGVTFVVYVAAAYVGAKLASRW